MHERIMNFEEEWFAFHDWLGAPLNFYYVQVQKTKQHLFWFLKEISRMTKNKNYDIPRVRLYDFIPPPLLYSLTEIVTSWF